MKLASFAFGFGILVSAFATPVLAWDYASAQKVVVIHNDRDASTTQIDFLTDGQGMSYKHDGTQSDFSLAQLKSGAVLEAQQGINALTVKGSIDPAKGGTLNFVYIANGMSGSYKTCSAILQRGNGGEWQLFNSATHARVQDVKVMTWQFGISTIQGICPN